MKRFDDKTLPSSCHVTCGLISGAEGLNFSPRRRRGRLPPLRRHRTATRTQKTKRRLRLVEDEMAPFDGDRRDIPLTRRRRRRPPDNLSPMAASSSLFAAAAALLLIVCCTAAAAAGVAAGIPTQLSPEVEEHLGGGGGGVSLFPFPVRSQQHDVDDGETGTEHRTKTSNEEKSGNGKTLEETEEKEDEDEDEEPGVAPPYMLELYRKFSNDKQSHPTADIVRSFKNINSGGVTSVWTSDNCTWTALHSLHFNISSSSISENEDVQMAELRLRTSKKTLTVLVYEVIAPSPDRSPTPPPPPQPLSRLLTSRDVSPEERSTWQTFSVTEALRRWTKKQTTSVGHVFQVRVDTVHRSNDDDEPDAAGSDVSADDDKTILVVFSNDRKRRRVASRELREIQTHENEAREKERRRRRMRRRRNRRHYYPPSSRSSPTPRPSSPKEEEEEESTSDKNSTTDAASAGHRTRPAASLEGRMTTNRTAVDREGLKNRSKSRGRRRGRRNSCRRKPMYVDFLDVKWENWVIQPSGYQAYECTGQCYFPIVQRLTPTKYAVVKSLLHATYPKRAGAACCVPTRLEPIPLLYRDEQGVVTYQSQYEDMVVAECGCR